MPKITQKQWLDELFDLYMLETSRKSVSEDSPEFINWLNRKSVEDLEKLLEKVEKKYGKTPSQKTKTATD